MHSCVFNLGKEGIHEVEWSLPRHLGCEIRILSNSCLWTLTLKIWLLVFKVPYVYVLVLFCFVLFGFCLIWHCDNPETWQAPLTPGVGNMGPFTCCWMLIPFGNGQFSWGGGVMGIAAPKQLEGCTFPLPVSAERRKQNEKYLIHARLQPEQFTNICIWVFLSKTRSYLFECLGAILNIQSWEQRRSWYTALISSQPLWSSPNRWLWVVVVFLNPSTTKTEAFKFQEMSP